MALTDAEKHNRRPRVPCSECGLPSGWFVTDKRRGDGPVRCRACRPKGASQRSNPTVAWTCARCGKACNRSSVRGQRPKYCSKQCQQCAADSRRRALEHHAFVEEVSPAEVFTSDGYRCHLCGRKTDRTKVVPHRRAPTVDHVLPLSKGGMHERSNCRTACFGCNASKQDRGGGEQFAIAFDWQVA